MRKGVAAATKMCSSGCLDEDLGYILQAVPLSFLALRLVPFFIPPSLPPTLLG